MAKKIDLKRTLGNPSPSFSVDAIEEMTRQVHVKREETKAIPEPTPAVVEKVVPKKEEPKAIVVAPPAPKVEEEPTKRGRKPSPPASDERMIRVSVDLPESVFIKLKVKVIQEKTDMKTWVWRLVENELNK